MIQEVKVKEGSGVKVSQEGHGAHQHWGWCRLGRLGCNRAVCPAVWGSGRGPGPRVREGWLYTCGPLASWLQEKENHGAPLTKRT